MRILYAPTSRGIPAGFSLASGERATFLCVAKETWPKERPPRCSGLRASCPATAQRDSGGSLTAHPCAGSELGAIPCAHPAGYPSAALPLHRGPIHCASCAAKTKQVPARIGFGFGSRFCAQDARYMGPLDRGETAEELSEGWPTGSGPVRRQSTDGLSANPVAGSRTRSTGTVRRARAWGWPSLYSGLLPYALRASYAVRAAPAAQWLLSLGHTRESDSLAGRRVKVRHGCRATKERKENYKRRAGADTTKDPVSSMKRKERRVK